MVRRASLSLIVFFWLSPVWAALDISPSFLGMYRKTMEIDDELSTHAARYGVDPRLARAVIIQESGGDANLVSTAGARGYFQVMPRTFRMLRARTNVEAGIKYLAHLQKQFDREDYTIAAYNAGPSTITKDRRLRLETLQYVINVGHYRWILRLYEPEIRRQAQALQLRRVHRGDSWETLARATGIPSSALRLYNPFLAVRPLQAGSLVAYPPSVPANLFKYVGDEVYYTSRIGDSCLQLALIFGVPLETFRAHNNLWHLQQLPAGVRLRLALPANSPLRKLQQLVSEERPAQEPLTDHLLQSVFMEQPPQGQKFLNAQPVETIPIHTEHPPEFRTYEVQKGDTLDKIARRRQTTATALMQANGLHDTRLRVGTVLRIPAIGPQDSPTQRDTLPKAVLVYKVRRGDTLYQIARRYRTTVRALLHANGLRHARLKVGTSLRIP